MDAWAEGATEPGIFGLLSRRPDGRQGRAPDIMRPAMSAPRPLSVMEILISIKKTRLFGELPGDAIKRLADFIQQKRVATGQNVFVEGDLGEEMYFLHSGLVTLLHKTSGGNRTVATLEPGDHFGEMAIIDGSPRLETAVAQADSMLLVLDRTGFESAIRDYPDVAFNIFRQLTERLREAEKRLRATLEQAPERRS